MLEASNAVDDELKKMKGLLGGSSDAGSNGTWSVDDELAKFDAVLDFKHMSRSITNKKWDKYIVNADSI